MQPVQIDDLLNYRFLSDLSIAPNGELAAFVVKQGRAVENDYRSDLYLVRLDRPDARPLTSGGTDGPFVWTDDGAAIDFLTRRDNPECSSIARIRIDGGEAQPLGRLPHKAEALARLPGEAYLYTARVPISDEGERSDAADYQVLTEIPFWRNGKGFTDRRRLHLFRLDPGEAPEDLIDPALEVESFDVRAARVAVVAQRMTGKAPITDELWLYDLDAGTVKRLSHGRLAIDAVRFLSDDALVLVASEMSRYGLNENREVLRLDLASGELRSLTPGWDRSVGNSVVADCRSGGGPICRVDGDRTYVVVTERTSSFVVAVDPASHIEPVTESGGAVDAFDVRGRIVLTVELRSDRLQEVYRTDRAGRERLTDLNGPALSGRAVASSERFSVPSPGGAELDAWIVRPTAFDPAGRCPAVLTVHGGPRAAFGDLFFHEIQILAAAGYAVVYTNPRGSSGRGNDFADLRGKYGTIDVEDLMAVVDAAVDRYSFVDPDRLAVVGGSYGGFMTNWLIGRTDRFRAAVSQRSISNWISKFCTTDIGYFFNKDQIGADPWEPGGSDRLWSCSPLRHADRVRTPTLFIHSDEDYRCWLPEGVQMFTALRYHGVEARFVLFRGEHHELSRSGAPRHRIRRLEEIVAWLNGHLKEAERAPGEA